jgi:hypothetical protein
MAFQVLEHEFRGRPLIRNLLWCWHITQAKPKATIGMRWNAACGMAAWEVSPDRNKHIPGQIERWLRGGRLGSIIISGGDVAREALMGAVGERNNAKD